MQAGLGLKPALLDELLESDGFGGRSFLQATVFEDLDFDFQESIKNLDVVERAACFRLYLRGLEAISEKNVAAGEDYLMRAFRLLESAIEANPSDLFLCLLMGDICGALARTIHDRETASLFTERAGEFLAQAATADRNCQPAQSKYGGWLGCFWCFCWLDAV